MREAIAAMDELAADATKRPADKIRLGCERARHMQVTGRVVMFDKVMPGDPEDAVTMMLIGTAEGYLVRVPLTAVEVQALIEIAGQGA